MKRSSTEKVRVLLAYRRTWSVPWYHGAAHINLQPSGLHHQDIYTNKGNIAKI